MGNAPLVNRDFFQKRLLKNCIKSRMKHVCSEDIRSYFENTHVAAPNTVAEYRRVKPSIYL